MAVDDLYMIPIGTIVRRHRKALGMTLDRLAQEVTDYDAGNLSRFERGKQAIDEGKLREIAAALKIPLSQLYTESEGREERDNAPSMVADIPYIINPYVVPDKALRQSLEDLVSATKGVSPDKVEAIIKLITLLIK